MTKKLEKLIVTESDQVHASPGNFGAKIEEGKVLLPTNIYEPFSQFGIMDFDVGILVANYQHLPSFKGFLATHLGWKEKEVQEAYEGFVDLVRDHVSDECLNWKPTKYSMGALKPKDKD